MGSSESRLCSQCEGIRGLEFTCEICSKILCKYCIDGGADNWKTYHINICKECRPFTVNKYKLERIQCCKCETRNSYSGKYYIRKTKIFCEFCEFERRIIKYKKI